MKDHLKSLAVFLNDNLKENNDELQKETIKCLTIIIESSGEDSSFGELIPIIITAMDKLFKKENFDEAVVYQVFETIMGQIEINSKSIDPYLIDIVKYLLSESVLMNQNLPVCFKEAALEIFTVISDFRRPVLTKHLELLKNLVQVLFSLAQDKTKDSVRDSEETLQDITMFAIESLAKDLPKKKFYPMIKAKLDELCQSTEAKHHEAMFYVYGAIAEGHSDNLRKILPTLMTNIFPIGLTHENSDVRYAAMKACCYFSEFVQPEILDYHEKVVPALLNNITEKNKEEVVEHTIFALDLFIENMDENDMAKHLPILVPQFINITNSQSATYKMRYCAIDALGSAIVSGKNKILPYFEQIYTCLTSIFNLSNDDTLQGLKSSAILALGKLANFCCKDNRQLFNEKFSNILQHCINTPIEEGDYNWIEGVYTFYYNCAALLEEEFSPVIPSIIEPIFLMAGSHKGVTALKDEGEIDLQSEDDDEYLGDSPIANMSLNFVHAKSAAIRCLGEFAKSLPVSFHQYFQRVTTIIDENYVHAHENVRHQSMLGLYHLMIGYCRAGFGGKMPEIVPGMANKLNLSQEALEFIDMEFYLKFTYQIGDEESKENVAIYLELLHDAVEAVGPALLFNRLEDIASLLEQVFNFEIKCFIKGDEEGDQDDEEADTKIFSDSLGCIYEISKVLKNECKDFIVALMPSVKQTLEKGDVFEHEEMFGIFSDVFRECPNLLPVIREQFTQLIFASVDIMDEAVSRNAAFCLGEMFEINPEAMLPTLAPCLMYLQSLDKEAH